MRLCVRICSVKECTARVKNNLTIKHTLRWERVLSATLQPDFITCVCVGKQRLEQQKKNLQSSQETRYINYEIEQRKKMFGVFRNFHIRQCAIRIQ